MIVESICARLSERQPEMLASIERLVSINSFTDNVAGGNAVASVLTEMLTAIPGVEVRALESTRFARHLVATTPAARASAAGCVAIVGHLDTVFPPDTFEGFRIDGSLARGPGVLDMKGGLVCAIEALAALASTNVLDRASVRFVIVSDEEVGSPEGRPLLERELAGAACALVLEAGRKGDAIITRRKGTGAVKATARGKAAHAGNAHKEGVNAIWALARFVDRAQALTDYARGITVNVGKFTGGQSKNTVPDGAEALLDFRFETIAEGREIERALAKAAEDAAASVPGAEIETSGGIARQPLERSDASARLCTEYGACARRLGLGDGEAALIGGGSDASTTSAIGIPSIDGLGPRGSGFHTKEELIEIATLVPKAQAIAIFLAQRLVG